MQTLKEVQKDGKQISELEQKEYGELLASEQKEQERYLVTEKMNSLPEEERNKEFKWLNKEEARAIDPDMEVHFFRREGKLTGNCYYILRKQL